MLRDFFDLQEPLPFDAREEAEDEPSERDFSLEEEHLDMLSFNPGVIRFAYAHLNYTHHDFIQSMYPFFGLDAPPGGVRIGIGKKTSYYKGLLKSRGRTNLLRKHPDGVGSDEWLRLLSRQPKEKIRELYEIGIYLRTDELIDLGTAPLPGYTEEPVFTHKDAKWIDDKYEREHYYANDALRELTATAAHETAHYLHLVANTGAWKTSDVDTFHHAIETVAEYAEEFYALRKGYEANGKDTSSRTEGYGKTLRQLVSLDFDGIARLTESDPSFDSDFRVANKLSPCTSWKILTAWTKDKALRRKFDYSGMCVNPLIMTLS